MSDSRFECDTGGFDDLDAGVVGDGGDGVPNHGFEAVG